jgi:hypothetical protein
MQGDQGLFCLTYYCVSSWSSPSLLGFVELATSIMAKSTGLVRETQDVG